MKLFAIYDKQHETHGPIFEFINDELGKRFFKGLLENPESQIHKYPQDYKLVSLGSYNKETGEIVNERKSVDM